MSGLRTDHTILVVDDDSHVRDALRPYLTDAGYTVVEAATIGEGLEQLERVDPALVVLDLRLPDGNGLDFCRELRRRSNTPVVMLTSAGDPIQRIVGLELGADDYICKPFVPREVVARVEAVLRRGARPAAAAAGVLRVGRMEVDLDRHEVRIGDVMLSLTPTEFRVLAMLTAEPGRVFSRDELLEAAGGGTRPESVDRHVTSLRRKLEGTPDRQPLIEAVYGIGYKLIEGKD